MPRRPANAPLELPSAFLEYAKAESGELSEALATVRKGLDRYNAAERARKRRFAGKSPDQLREELAKRLEEIEALRSALNE